MSSESLFAPTDLAFIAEPYGAYAELRRAAPVHYDVATDHWLVSRYDDVNALLRDRRFRRTFLHITTHEAMGRKPWPEWHEPFWQLIHSGILDMEPPDHTRVRSLVSKAFTPRMVDRLREPVRLISESLVDDALDQGEFDLITAIAEPLPVAVIAELLA